MNSFVGQVLFSSDLDRYDYIFDEYYLHDFNGIRKNKIYCVFAMGKSMPAINWYKNYEFIDGLYMSNRLRINNGYYNNSTFSVVTDPDIISDVKKKYNMYQMIETIEK